MADPRMVAILEIMMQYPRSMTSSLPDADFKGNVFRLYIYPLILIVIAIRLGKVWRGWE